MDAWPVNGSDRSATTNGPRVSKRLSGNGMGAISVDVTAAPELAPAMRVVKSCASFLPPVSISRAVLLEEASEGFEGNGCGQPFQRFNVEA